MSPSGGAFDGLEPALAEAVVRAKGTLGARDFLERVGLLVGESGELLTPEVAADVVLDELGLLVPVPEPPAARPASLAPDALEPGLDGLTVEGTLLGLEPTRSFPRSDGSRGFVARARVRGEQGIYEVTLWDEHIQTLVGAVPGALVGFEGLYTKERQGKIELHTGRDARVTLRPSTP